MLKQMKTRQKNPKTSTARREPDRKKRNRSTTQEPKLSSISSSFGFFN